MKQATEILRFALTKIDDFKIQGAARWMIYLFVALLMCCIALFIIGWIFTWKNTGVISLGDSKSGNNACRFYLGIVSTTWIQFIYKTV